MENAKNINLVNQKGKIEFSPPSKNPPFRFFNYHR